MRNKRIIYLDFARGLAIFFMIMQHAMIMHEYSGGEGNALLGNFFLLAGTAPAAPVFLFIMGVFLMKSKKTVKEQVVRGIMLFFLGYGLNFLRFTVPLCLIGQTKNLMPGAFNAIKESGSDIFVYGLRLLLTVDIFQLAGLSLIALAPLKRFSKNNWFFPGLMVVILIISPYLWGSFGKIMFFDPLWGTSDLVDFPFFPWCIYLLLGMYMSSYFNDSFMDQEGKTRLIKLAGVIGITGALTINFFPIGDYYRSGLGVHLLIISFLFLWLILCNRCAAWLSRGKGQKLVEIVCFWSSHVTEIYVLQWILYGLSIMVLGNNRLSDYKAAGFGFLMMLFCHFVMKLKDRLLKS